MLKWFPRDREVFVKEFPDLNVKPYRDFARKDGSMGSLKDLTGNQVSLLERDIAKLRY